MYYLLSIYIETFDHKYQFHEKEKKCLSNMNGYIRIKRFSQISFNALAISLTVFKINVFKAPYFFEKFPLLLE